MNPWRKLIFVVVGGVVLVVPATATRLHDLLVLRDAQFLAVHDARSFWTWSEPAEVWKF